jgi:SAM-dependent methyltransferase
MYRAIRELDLSFSPGAKVCSISHSENLLALLDANQAEVFHADYPDYEMQNLPLESGSFDLLLADQVLEHVEHWPEVAVSECLRVLKPGGIGIITTCLINPVHKHPGDFWRFTPDGLALLVRDKAEVVEAAGWGNLDAVKLLGTPIRRALVPARTWHPLHRIASKNDPEWPISTWLVFRKHL